MRFMTLGERIIGHQYQSYDSIDYVFDALDVQNNFYDSNEYKCPDSNVRYLTDADLESFSKEDCKIARNEIYARHGRKFNDEFLQEYFNSCQLV